MARASPGCWSAGRLARRAAYQSFMTSPAWRARRAWWAAEWRRRYGCAPWCLLCGRPWHLADGDVHHLSYAHLGQEAFAELWGLHRACHEALHAMIEAATAKWRSRAEASLAAVAFPRARATTGPSVAEDTSNGQGPGVSTAAFPGDFAAFAEVFEGPLYWPDVPAEQLEEAYGALRMWVEQAAVRFSWDSQVLPGCWWRHAAFVEALVALRDHERGSYAPTASATAAIEFHRAIRDVEARLRAWRTELRCEAAHDPSHDEPRTLPNEGFADYVADQVRRRKAAEEKAKAEEEAKAKDHQN